MYSFEDAIPGLLGDHDNSLTRMDLSDCVAVEELKLSCYKLETFTLSGTEIPFLKSNPIEPASSLCSDSA